MRAMIVLCVVFFPAQVFGAYSPDELYDQGRYLDAKKAYEILDMDYPGQVQFRYNKGCAAYKAKEYSAARAAFLSVARRSKDNNMRFNAFFNLGNSAYKEGAFNQAIEAFKEALALKPDQEDARYNLELSLRAKKKQENKKKDQTEKQQHKKDQGDRQDQDKGNNKNTKDQADKNKQGNQDKGKTKGKNADANADKEASGQRDNKEKPAGQGSQAQLANEGEHGDAPGKTKGMIGRQKAGALLDNVHEDRSRFYRFQVPDAKKSGVKSGKYW